MEDPVFPNLSVGPVFPKAPVTLLFLSYFISLWYFGLWPTVFVRLSFLNFYDNPFSLFSSIIMTISLTPFTGSSVWVILKCLWYSGTYPHHLLFRLHRLFLDNIRHVHICSFMFITPKFLSIVTTSLQNSKPSMFSLWLDISIATFHWKLRKKVFPPVFSFFIPVFIPS